VFNNDWSFKVKYGKSQWHWRIHFWVGRVAPRAPPWSGNDGARGATRPTKPNRAKVVVTCHRLSGRVQVANAAGKQRLIAPVNQRE